MFTNFRALPLCLAASAIAMAPAAGQESQPADPAAFKALAKELQKSGRLEEAAANYKKAWLADGTVESGLSWAKALLEDMRYNDSLRAADELIEKYKKDVRVYRFCADAQEARAGARAREGADRTTVCAEYEAAARSIEDALQIEPANPELLALNIRYLLYASKPEEALEAADRARKAAPTSGEVAMWRGDALYHSYSIAGFLVAEPEATAEAKQQRESKIKEILAVYEEAAELAPKSAETHQRIGAFLFATGGAKSRATAAFVKAIAADPSKCDMSAAMAALDAKEQLELFKSAEVEFKKLHPKVSDTDPIDAPLHWYLGFAKFHNDDRKGAAENYNTVLKKNPSDMTARYWLGTIAFSEKNYKNAAAEFSVILQKSPRALADLGRSDNAFYPMVQRLVAFLLSADESGPVTGLSNTPELKQAILLTRAILEVDPKNVVEWNNLGLFYRDSGNPKEALEAYKKALDITPNDPRLLNDAGVIYHYNLPPTPENDAEAKQLYQRSIARAKAVLEDKKSGAIEKETARGALQDATVNLRRLEKGDHKN